MTGKKAEITKLSDLQDEIRGVLHGSFSKACWVVAEVSEIKENYSGHCYLDLVEKDENSEKLLAKARATIWSSAYRMLKPYFETTTGYELVAGIKIMVSASVEYHPVYGLSLNIKDIDPSYTLGDVERKRQEIISRLEKEGVLNMNKETILPEVPQKIAVISSQTAAGYEDFLEQLINNPYGYKFYSKLYPAAMQGDKAESSIISSLERIFEHENFFDLVVIIRGGGSKSDLACFDNYELAFHVSQFPIPIITGIGHEQDDTITDLVAHTRLKTPTAVAGFLIDRLATFEVSLNECSEILIRESQRVIQEKKLQLQLVQQQTSAGAKAYLADKTEGLLRLTAASRHSIQQTIGSHRIRILRLGEQLKNNARNLPVQKRTELMYISRRLKQQINVVFEHEGKRLANYTKLKDYAEPVQILKLGFSISRYKGKALKDTSLLNQGDSIVTELSKGKIQSKVTDIEKKLYIRKQRKDPADP
ncbi:exodeoxyribonuclease VII large subunit [Bacteroidota bacterium]